MRLVYNSCMNRNIGIAIAVVVLLGLGGFLFLKKSPATPTDDSKMTQTTGGSTTSEKSLKELVTSGASQQCTFNNPDSKESMGTVYVSGGKVRGDFTVSVQGKDMTTHMIGDGTNSYIWTDGQTTGIKMAFDPATEVQNSNTPTQSNGVDVNAKMNYNCESWTADQSKFEVPTTVTFTGINVPKTGTVVKGSTESDMKIQQCAACDNIPPSGREECKKALGC